MMSYIQSLEDAAITLSDDEDGSTEKKKAKRVAKKIKRKRQNKDEEEKEESVPNKDNSSHCYKKRPEK